MFNWVKEFFRAKEVPQVDPRAAEKRVYERQKEHHKRRAESNPARADFHNSMAAHCDDIIEATPTKSYSRSPSFESGSIYCGSGSNGGSSDSPSYSAPSCDSGSSSSCSFD